MGHNEDRRDGMGSTDVVEIMDLSPYEGAGKWRVWNQKLGIAQDETSTPEQSWGHVQEAVLVDWYIAKHGTLVVRNERIRSRNDPWLWATPDAAFSPTRPSVVSNIDPDNVVRSCGYLEAKNVGRFMCKDWDESEQDGIPDYVRVQVTIGMYCACVTEWTVIAQLGGHPPHIFRVGFDPKLAKLAVDAGREFWQAVQSGKPPMALDASDACREYLVATYPRERMRMIDATPRQHMLAVERAACASEEKRCKVRKREIDALLLADMKENAILMGPGGDWKMTWKTHKNGVRTQRFTAKGLGDGDEE